MKVRGVVVDMDGTITKFNLDYKAARQQVLDELERQGLRTPDMSTDMSLWILLGKLKDTLPPERFLALRSTFYKFFEEMELKAAKDVTLYPGVEKTLHELRSKQLKLGLVTNNSRSGTELTLKRFSLGSIFDAIVTRDDCDEMKPSPSPLLKVLSDLRLRADDAIFVGDGVIDILAAKAAGIRCAAVTPDPFPLQRTINAEPDYLLGSLNDLPMLLDHLDA